MLARWKEALGTKAETALGLQKPYGLVCSFVSQYGDFGQGAAESEPLREGSLHDKV